MLSSWQVPGDSLEHVVLRSTVGEEREQSRPPPLGFSILGDLITVWTGGPVLEEPRVPPARASRREYFQEVGPFEDSWGMAYTSAGGAKGTFEYSPTATAPLLLIYFR